MNFELWSEANQHLNTGANVPREFASKTSPLRSCTVSFLCSHCSAIIYRSHIWCFSFTDASFHFHITLDWSAWASFVRSNINCGSVPNSHPLDLMIYNIQNKYNISITWIYWSDGIAANTHGHNFGPFPSTKPAKWHMEPYLVCRTKKLTHAHAALALGIVNSCMVKTVESKFSYWMKCMFTPVSWMNNITYKVRAQWTHTAENILAAPWWSRMCCVLCIVYRRVSILGLPWVALNKTVIILCIASNVVQLHNNNDNNNSTHSHMHVEKSV